MLGQTAPRFDIGDLFTKQRIVIVNLTVVSSPSHAAKLLGTLLLGQLWSRLLARQTLPKKRRPHGGDLHRRGAPLHRRAPGIWRMPSRRRDRSVGARVHTPEPGSRAPPRRYPTGRGKHEEQNRLRHERPRRCRHSKTHPRAGAARPDAAAEISRLRRNVMQDGESTGWMSIRTQPPTKTLQHAADAYAASQERYGVPAEQTERDSSATPISTPRW